MCQCGFVKTFQDDGASSAYTDGEGHTEYVYITKTAALGEEEGDEEAIYYVNEIDMAGTNFVTAYGQDGNVLWTRSGRDFVTRYTSDAMDRTTSETGPEDL